MYVIKTANDSRTSVHFSHRNIVNERTADKRHVYYGGYNIVGRIHYYFQVLKSPKLQYLNNNIDVYLGSYQITDKNKKVHMLIYKNKLWTAQV